MKKIKLLIILFFLVFICSSCGADQITKDVKGFLKCRARLISFKEGEIFEPGSSHSSSHDRLIKYGMIQINQTSKKCELTKKGQANFLNDAFCGNDTGIVFLDLELLNFEKKEMGKSNGTKTYILNIKVKNKVRTWLMEEYQTSNDSYMKSLYKNIIESDGKTDVLQVRYPFQR